MRVQDILRRKDKDLITISVDASVHEAGKSISRERVGMLLVVDGQDKLVGVLSERDIVCFIAKRASARWIPVSARRCQHIGSPPHLRTRYPTSCAS